MSINPVPGTVPFEATAAAGTTTCAASSAAQAPEPHSSSPDLGPKPKSETQQDQKPSVASEVPEDEVRVQRDNSMNGEIVIRYVDAGGNLVLQIPSSQVLGLARAIEQALEKQTKTHTNVQFEGQVAEGGKI